MSARRTDANGPDSGARPTREEQITEAFVAIADTLVAGFDIPDYMDSLATRCQELLDVQAAGLLLADPLGRPQVVATSSHQAQLLEVFETQSDEGPCVECLSTGLTVEDIDADPQRSTRPDRWPEFTQLRREHGFGSVYAIPLRLRDDVIGALNLFRASPSALGASDLKLARGLADMAAIGLLQERAIHGHRVVADQLQTALNTRIRIEQAKGVLAERYGMDMDEAFTAIRGYARAHSQRLTDVTHQILTDALPYPLIDVAPAEDSDRPRGTSGSGLGALWHRELIARRPRPNAVPLGRGLSETTGLGESLSDDEPVNL